MSRTVLCVDDEPHILSALCRTFVFENFDVTTANSASAALGLLNGTAFDVIISDMRMPLVDGLQLLSQCQNQWPGMRRLLLTGDADVSYVQTALQQQTVQAVCGKPWDNDELLAQVNELLGI